MSRPAPTTVTRSTLKDLWRSRELLGNLTMREVRGKYKRTALGQLWSLVNPLALMAIYSLVFGFFLRFGDAVPPGDPSGLDVFALWLLCALLPWLFLNGIINAGMGSLVADGNLIKKVWFPRAAIVIAVALSWMVTHAVEMAVLAVVLLIAGAMVVPWLPIVAVFMVLMLCFATGIALMLAVANVYFRDTQHFVSIGMQLWFYLTPIIYPYRLIADQAAELRSQGIDLPIEFVYRLNPLERFVSVFRSLLYDTTWPQLGDGLYCLGAAIVSLVVGYWIFTRHEARIAEEL